MVYDEFLLIESVAQMYIQYMSIGVIKFSSVAKQTQRQLVL